MRATVRTGTAAAPRFAHVEVDVADDAITATFHFTADEDAVCRAGSVTLIESAGASKGSIASIALTAALPSYLAPAMREWLERACTAAAAAAGVTVVR